MTRSIVERELRVRARQRLTSWVRVIVGGVAALMGLLWFQNTAALGNIAETSRTVFAVLTWLCFTFCLFEGARQTADTLSSEKREGTLGLLFLTDLSGLGVTLGKLTAASLHSFYGLLAAFPVLGITLAAGGITAGEFWRTQLALLTTLFLASTAGLWISARSLDDSRAMLAVMGLMLGLTLVPLAGEVVASGRVLPSLSPAMGVWLAGDLAYRVAPGRFWLTQLVLQILAWGFLILAARLTSRVWRETAEVPVRKVKRARPSGGPGEGWNYCITPPLRAHARCPPLEANPATWLVSRQRALAPLIWVALLLPTLIHFGSMFLFRFLTSPWVGGAMLSAGWIGIEILSVGALALAAARPYSEARRVGAWELVLCTPLPVSQIVQAHWQAIWRMIRLPLTLVALVPTSIYLIIFATQSGGGGVMPWGYFAFALVPQTLSQVLKALAACWVGSWFGLSSRNTGHAVGRTLLWVMFIPWLAASLLSVLLSVVLGSGTNSPSSWWLWVRVGSVSLVPLAWLVGLVFWARHRLLTGFRETVTGANVGQAKPWWPKTHSRTASAPA